MMKLKISLLPILFVLALFTGCKTSEEELKDVQGTEDAGVDLLYTYTTANTKNWDPNDIVLQSFQGAGECKIENGFVIYTKTDLTYSGPDHCQNISGNYCSDGQYAINFSLETPKLEHTIPCL